MAKHPRKPERPHITRMKDHDIAEPVPKAKESEQCGNCRFWHVKHEESDAGYCRRYPGQVINPPTNWCGEFEPKPQEERITEDTS